MAVDIGTIPKSVIATITAGLRTEEFALADTMCTALRKRTTLSGTLPRKKSGRTLGRLDNVGLTPGARAVAHRGQMASTQYNCLANVGFGEVYDEEQNDLAAYGEDALEDATRMALVDANLAVDSTMVTALSSQILNNSRDIGAGFGKWNVAATSRPLKDIQIARYSLCLGADMIVYDPDVFQALIDHPDIIAEHSQFNAGQLDILGLNALLSRKTGIPVQNIYFIEKEYNSANQNQVETPVFLGSQLFWMGHKRDLILVDPEGAPLNNQTEVDRKMNGRKYEVQHVRYTDIIRPTKELGCVFFNIL